MKRQLFWLICFLTFISCENNHESSVQDACAKLDETDKEMLRIIRVIKDKYKTEPLFIKRLNMAQVYWVQYRDRHVEALFPLNKKLYERSFGDSYNLCKCAEWRKLTEQRIKDLSVWLKGPEIEECPTSIDLDLVK